MLIECVPNISEGRRLDVVQAIVDEIKAIPGVQFLDQSSDPDHNRSVLTFAGTPDVLETAVLKLFELAEKHIDLRAHTGEHPRMGAVDVVPFIPLSGATMSDCVSLAKRVAQKVSETHNLPVTLYEEAASAPHRKNLAAVRKGEFEGLSDKLQDSQWTPDFGPSVPHSSMGASAIGARVALIAYNVYLNTSDVTIAQNIAKAIRGSSGGLVHAKAMGVFVAERNQAQVSMNLVNYQKTPIYRVFELIKIEAARFGVSVASSEIVGLLPQEALLDAASYYLQIEGFSEQLILERRLSM
jgi:glutamate formiminotransferase / 5-formyltetrahydrofolate cyclo-ligase